jgi:fumarate reductase flavoprotein subunit
MILTFRKTAIAAMLCGAASMAVAAVTAGTYEGAAAGKLSTVKAAVTLDASGKITDVKIDASHETPSLGGVAAKQMAPAIVEHQSYAVDGVSGATVSSNAIRKAVAAAIEKAGADPKKYDVKVVRKPGKDETMSADVVVVGAGASGTAAALAAAENGAKVIVLEKTPAAGGAGKLASGLFAVESSLQKEKFKNDPKMLGELTREKLYTQLMDYNHYLNNAQLTRRVIDQSPSTIDWLQKYGAKLELIDWNPQQGQNPYPIRWRIYHRYVDNATAFKNMYASLGKMGGKLITQARAYDLTQDKDGNVTAVIAEKGDGAKLTIKTKALILASGGYGGDAKHLAKAMETNDLTNRIAWSNNGEGLQMAWKAGAQKMGENHALIHAAEFDGMSTSAAGDKGMVDSNLLVRVLKTPLLWVDQAGKRFCNEELIYDTVYWANAGYSVGGKYFVVVDSATLDDYTADKFPFEVSGAGPENPKGHGDFRKLADEAVRQGVAFKADTLEELAKKAGFTPAFVDQVAQYNKAVATGKDPFGKPAKFLKYPVKQGPFYAMRAKVVSLATLGGVRVNENFEALNANYKPIGGLYAVGNNAYGFYCTPSYPPYQGLALGFAYNSGRIAGMEAAKYVKAQQ